MNVKELTFRWPEWEMMFETTKIVNGIRFEIVDRGRIVNCNLDRSQAHLLMLYLQEHLKT